MKTFSNEQEKEPKTKAELAKIRERTELFVSNRGG